MRKIILCGLFLFLTATGFTQHAHLPFVEKSSIKWAAYANDTFRFTELNLNLFLRDQLVNNKIEARLTDYDHNTQIKVTVDSVKERISPNKILKVIDNTGNVVNEMVAAQNQLYDDRYFNPFTNNLVDIQQVIFVEDGRLRSHIAWVSPMYFVVTSMGMELGISNAFQTAFNSNPTIKKKWKKKALYLGKSSKKYMLNLLTAGTPLLKPMYGKNLLEAIWPYLGKKDMLLQDPSSLTMLSIKDISMFLLDSSVVEVPVYNEKGAIIEYKKTDLKDIPIPLTNVPFVMLEQEWFYISSQNKIYSNILSIECWSNKTHQGKVDELPAPFLKIIQAK